MRDTVKVIYKGWEIEVTGEFERDVPAHITTDPYYSEPAEGGEVVPEYIEIADTDITGLLSNKAYDEILEAAYEAWEEKKADAL